MSIISGLCWNTSLINICWMVHHLGVFHSCKNGISLFYWEDNHYSKYWNTEWLILEVTFNRNNFWEKKDFLKIPVFFSFSVSLMYIIHTVCLLHVLATTCRKYMVCIIYFHTLVVFYIISDCSMNGHGSFKNSFFNLCEKVMKVCIRYWCNLVLLFLESHF